MRLPDATVVRDGVVVAEDHSRAYFDTEIDGLSLTDEEAEALEDYIDSHGMDGWEMTDDGKVRIIVEDLQF